MKKANFIAGGRQLHGHLNDEGMLIDFGGEAHNPDDVTFQLPVKPGKVIALALNYDDHAAELNLQQPEIPAIFWKPNTSLLPHNGTVIYPQGAEFMHYEVELGVIIGQNARRVKAEDAYDYVGGYTIGNDIVVRDYVVNTFRPPIRGKGWDTFGPLGPYYVTKDEIPDPDNLQLRAYVNVSHVHPGDTMRLEVEGLGTLVNDIAWETETAEPMKGKEDVAKDKI